jgi:NAD(P)H-dependent FMN reductase
MPDVSMSSYPDLARERIANLAARYREADAMLWATPTYHGTELMQFAGRRP